MDRAVQFDHTFGREARALELPGLAKSRLEAFELGPEVWQREHLFGMLGGYVGQREHFHVVRVEAFQPEGTPDADVTERRWWTQAELAASRERFAPRRLP